MATLPPFFGPGTRGQEVRIGAHLGPIRKTVGSGRFTRFSEFDASFTGTYRILVYSGDADLTLALTDRNPAATSGPATVAVNGTTDTNARYTVSGDTLTITTTAIGSPGTLAISRGDGGTYVQPDGLPVNPKVRIAPE